jgi:hypothetical protein
MISRWQKPPDLTVRGLLSKREREKRENSLLNNAMIIYQKPKVNGAAPQFTKYSQRVKKSFKNHP